MLYRAPHSRNKRNMQNIDLSLAINYLPACSCMVRLFAYLLWLTATAMYASNDPRMFGVLGVLLYVDRVTQGRQSFFDGNSVLLTIYFSNIFQYVRRPSDDVHFSTLVAYVTWSALACVSVWDSVQLTKWVRQFIPLSVSTLQVLLTAAYMLYFLFTRAHPEPLTATVAKALGFAFIVIVWVYLIGLRKGPIEHHLYAVRFLPILILPYWVAFVFTWLAVFCMYAGHRRQLASVVVCYGGGGASSPHAMTTSATMTHHVAISEPLPTMMIPAAAAVAVTTKPAPEPMNDEPTDIEAMFRLAKQMQSTQSSNKTS